MGHRANRACASSSVSSADDLPGWPGRDVASRSNASESNVKPFALRRCSCSRKYPSSGGRSVTEISQLRFLSSEPVLSAVGRDGGQRSGSRAATDRFREAVGRAGSSFHELSGWPELVDHLGDVEVVAIAPSLARTWPHLVVALEDRGARVVIPDGDDPAAQVADVPVGVTWAEMAVAETGSLLVSEHELGDRVVTMLCRRLVQIVAADAIEARLEAAASWMQSRSGQPGFASLMTGPSRTADIERSLTIGVQGPDEVDVVVLFDTEVDAGTGVDAKGEVSA